MSAFLLVYIILTSNFILEIFFSCFPLGVGSILKVSKLSGIIKNIFDGKFRCARANLVGYFNLKYFSIAFMQFALIKYETLARLIKYTKYLKFTIYNIIYHHLQPL